MSLASAVPDRLRQLLSATGAGRVWLVGGALRDHLLGLPIRDLDLAVDGDAIQLGRTLAKGLAGDFYVLDRERGAARIVEPELLPGIRTLDLVRLHPDGIEQDLRNRDFTANALATPLPESKSLLDPTSGLQDIKDQTLKACSPHAIKSDPVRALRAVRLALSLDFSLDADTTAQIRDGASKLYHVSVERIRDEFLLMLKPGLAHRSVRLLEHLGLLAGVTPELVHLRGCPLPERLTNQTASRSRARSGGSVGSSDLWDHTLEVVRWLDELMVLLADGLAPESTGNIVLAEASLRLGRFREQLARRMSAARGHGRSADQISLLAALYHEAGWPTSEKQQTARSEPDQDAADLVRARCVQLRLSNGEARWAAIMLRHQRRPQHLRDYGVVPPLEIYRFFREVGEVGLSILLLSLAEVLVEQAPGAHAEAWRRQLGVARQLMEAYLEGPPETIRPPRLIRGDELAQELGVRPGAELGRLLRSIEEAQVQGELRTAEQALAWARRSLGESSNE